MRNWMLGACLLAAAAMAQGQPALADADTATIAAALRQWQKIDPEERNPTDAATFDACAYRARQMGWRNLEMNLSRELGHFYRETGFPDAAQQWFRRLFDMACESSDSLGIALALANLGNTFMGQGDHKNAIEYNRRALGIRLRHESREQPVRLANSFMFVGISLMRLGKLAEAEAHFLRSRDIREHKADSAGMGLLLGNLGNLALFQKNPVLAEEYFRQSFAFQKTEKTRAQALATYYENLGEAYAETGDARRAIEHFERSLIILDTLKWERRRRYVLFNLGNALLRAGQREAGEMRLREAFDIAQRRGVLTMARDIQWALYESAQQAGLPQKALACYQVYELYKDSLARLESARSLARLTVEQDILRKDKEIGLLRQTAEAQRQRQLYLLAGLALALALLSVIYYLNRLRQRAFFDMKRRKQEAETLLEEKENLLHNLRETQQQLIQHEKMAALGQLTAGIAHELNNPLNFILNNAVALRMDYDDLRQMLRESDFAHAGYDELEAEMGKLIAGTENGAERMRNIVQELVAFSRAEPMLPEMVDLQEVVGESLQLLQQGERARWRVEQSWPQVVPRVVGFSGKLVQLFSNLLANAFDALESRWGGQFERGQIIIEATLAADNQLRILLKDNGPGMDEATRHRVFDPFFTTKPVGKGTGLGLSIVFSIVKAHRGHIEALSQPGEGTVFEIYLPTEGAQ